MPLDQIEMLPMESIFADHDFNCRGKVSPIDVIELARDIQENSEKTPPLGLNQTGLLYPVMVIRYSSPERPTKQYKLIAGYRRYVAFTVNKRTEIPAIISHDLTPFEACTVNLKENLQRKELNILQEAKGLAFYKNAGYSEQMVIKELNVTRGWLQARWMLLDLPKEIQHEAAAGLLTQTQIRDLYSIKNNEKRFEAVKKIKEAKLKNEKKLSTIRVATNKNTKRIRTRPEITQLQNLIQEQIGNNIGTRLLAWTAGEVDDKEIYDALVEYAKEKELNFVPPELEV